LEFAVLKAILLKPIPRNDWSTFGDCPIPVISLHVEPPFVESRIPNP